MTLNAKKVPGKKFNKQVLEEPGTYPARVVQVLCLGLQEQQPYQGQEKEPGIEIHVTYELLDEFMKDEDGNEMEDKPRWISETFVLHSLDSDLAKSTKRYSALDPEFEYDGDWSKLAGTPCMVTVTLNKSKKDPNKIYENVSAVSGMRSKDAAKAAELKNPPKVFDLEEPDMEVFGSLPNWIQDKIKNNLEYEGSALEKLVESQGDSDGGKSQKKKEATPEPSEEVSEASEGEDGDDW